jgi:hypothetical protein
MSALGSENGVACIFLYPLQGLGQEFPKILCRVASIIEIGPRANRTFSQSTIGAVTIVVGGAFTT